MSWWFEGRPGYIGYVSTEDEAQVQNARTIAINSDMLSWKGVTMTCGAIDKYIYLWFERIALLVVSSNFMVVIVSLKPDRLPNYALQWQLCRKVEVRFNTTEAMGLPLLVW